MVDQQQLWDDEAARNYDTPGEGMFSDSVLGPTVAVLTELAEGGRAVEFAIGTGRVAISLSAAGIDVSGIELSHAMIVQLQAKADDGRIPVVQGDMTTAVVGEDFSLAFLVFNTIANLLTQDEQVQCFRNAAHHLRPGGRFVVDTYDTLRQQVISHHVTFGSDISDGRHARISRTPHRYIWPSELDLMARIAGFELENRWADWDRNEFTAESRSHVSVYKLSSR